MKSIAKMLAELPEKVPYPPSIYDYEDRASTAIKQRDRAWAELAVLKAAAEKWTDHIWTCESWEGVPACPCNCGYDDLQAVLEALGK